LLCFITCITLLFQTRSCVNKSNARNYKAKEGEENEQVEPIERTVQKVGQSVQRVGLQTVACSKQEIPQEVPHRPSSSQ
jgi:hypothetical protein